MRWIVVVLCMSSFACSSIQHDQKKWKSSSTSASPYEATLTEDDYNFGESNQYSLRIDARTTKGGDGWFFEGPLEAGGAIHSPKPQLFWTSPTDLRVVVQTADLQGQTIRRFGGDGQPKGSVTVRYIARGPSIY